MSLDLAQLYDAHAPALYGFLLNLSRSRADSADLLQEVFLRLIRRPSILDGVREHRAFLLRLAHNLAIDKMRRRTAFEGALDRAALEPKELFAPCPTPLDESFARDMAHALGELPEEQRAVLHLKVWEQMTFAQIAETLAISANTAASRYRYAVDKLRASLRQPCEP